MAGAEQHDVQSSRADRLEQERPVRRLLEMRHCVRRLQHRPRRRDRFCLSLRIGEAPTAPSLLTTSLPPAASPSAVTSTAGSSRSTAARSALSHCRWPVRRLEQNLRRAAAALPERRSQTEPAQLRRRRAAGQHPRAA